MGRSMGWTLDAARVHDHPGRMVRPLPQPRHPRRPHRPIRWLHQLSDLLTQATLAQRLARTQGGQDGAVAERRLRQRIGIAQRLLDPLPPGLRNPTNAAEGFWRLLRWGGVGMLLAAWLRP